jgi:uncharacterized caspase-like protein
MQAIKSGAVRAVVAAMCLLTVSAVAQAPGDVRIALVIGNAAYAGAAALANPGSDAKAMGETLRGLGFSVVEVRDGSREQMVQAISRVGEGLRGKQGVGMLYYAGHGLQLDWRNYMVPVDAKLQAAADVPVQTVDVSAVMEAFKLAGNRMNIMVLDACRDNPFAGSASGKGLAQLDAPPGTFLAYATAPGNTAEDGGGVNGLYTQYLLEELKKPQARIEDVFKRTRFAVRKASSGRQIPWESTSLEDDFYFNSGRVMAVAKPDDRQREAAFNQEKADWEKVRASSRADDYYAFLARYPSGSYSEYAQSLLEQLQKAQLQPQAGRDGRSALPPTARKQVGEQYEIVWKDGLTGLTTLTSRVEVRQRADDEFELAAVGGPAAPFVFDKSGFTVQDALGKYDPPLLKIPGGEFKVGNKASVRSLVTSPAGGRFWVDFDMRIAAKETIATAFGPLETYRIDTSALSQGGQRVTTSQWYDPDWGQSTRTRVEIRRGNAPPDIRIREVVSRSRKG